VAASATVQVTEAVARGGPLGARIGAMAALPAVDQAGQERLLRGSTGAALATMNGAGQGGLQAIVGLPVKDRWPGGLIELSLVGPVAGQADAVTVAAADDLEGRRRRQGAGPVAADGQPEGQDQGAGADGAKPTLPGIPSPPAMASCTLEGSARR
jgi:hypothetical protein